MRREDSTNNDSDENWVSSDSIDFGKHVEKSSIMEEIVLTKKKKNISNQLQQVGEKKPVGKVSFSSSVVDEEGDEEDEEDEVEDGLGGGRKRRKREKAALKFGGDPDDEDD